MPFIPFLLRRAFPLIMFAALSAAVLPTLADTSPASKTTFSSPKIIEETRTQRERFYDDGIRVNWPRINIPTDGTLASIIVPQSQPSDKPQSNILDMESAKQIESVKEIEGLEDHTSSMAFDFYSYQLYLSDNGKIIVGASPDFQKSWIYDRKNRKFSTIDEEDKFVPKSISPDGSVLVGFIPTNIDDGDFTAAIYKEGKVTPLSRFEIEYDDYSPNLIMEIAGDNDTIIADNGVGEYEDGVSSVSSYIYHIKAAKKTKIELPDDGAYEDYVSVLARAISNDASTVVGYMGGLNGETSAFIYDVKQEKMKIEEMKKLGEKITYLGLDQYAVEQELGWQNSSATDISNDGNVIVGIVSGNPAEDGFGATAFYYDRNKEEITDLGALAGSSVKDTTAYAVSGDGRVVIGEATVTEENSGEDDERHLLVWRINASGASEKGDSSKTPGASSKFSRPVDFEETQKTFTKMAEKDHDLQALARGQLDGLATMHCALEDKTYCIGVFGNANRVGHDGHLMNSGIHGALRFAPRWRAGLSLSYLANDSLPGGIKSRGRHTPGLGAYLSYAQNTDRSGLSVTASAAWQKQKLAIRRTTVGDLTEPGRGDSEIKGTLLALDGAYGVKLAEGTLLSPTLGLRYLNTRRDGYQETRESASLPATYGKSGERSTALRVGVGLDHALSPRWSLHGDAGTRIVLARDRDAFTVHGQYLGGVTYDLSPSGEKGRVLPYANVGLSARWGAHRASLVHLDVGIAKSDYGDSDAHIGVSYNYRF